MRWRARLPRWLALAVLLDNVDWPEQRTAAQNVLDRLVDAAHRDETIPADITAIDIALATIRFCRPLAIGLDRAEEPATAHRQLDIYVDGLTQSQDRRGRLPRKWTPHTTRG